MVVFASHKISFATNLENVARLSHEKEPPTSSAGHAPTGTETHHELYIQIGPRNGGWSLGVKVYAVPVSESIEVYRINLNRIKSKKKPIWINIVPETSKLNRPVPLTEDDAEDLLIDFTDGSFPSLHEYFKPFPGGITFWHDVESGYEVNVTQDAHKKSKSERRKAPHDHHYQFASHNRYVFTLRDGPYDVKIHENWELMNNLTGKLEGVDTIVVSPHSKHRRGGGHGTHMSPPQKIGR